MLQQTQPPLTCPVDLLPNFPARLGIITSNVEIRPYETMKNVPCRLYWLRRGTFVGCLPGHGESSQTYASYHSWVTEPRWSTIRADLPRGPNLYVRVFDSDRTNSTSINVYNFISTVHPIASHQKQHNYDRVYQVVLTFASQRRAGDYTCCNWTAYHTSISTLGRSRHGKRS